MMYLRRLLVFLVPALLLPVGVAEGAVLVPPGATWRWRPGTNEASAPVAAWRGLGFRDVEFTAAPAPFWYGDELPGGTRIVGMQNVYGCVFLRTTFVVPRPEEVGGVRMEALVDDGFVAWINGTEVVRVGVAGEAGSAVSTATLAANAAEPVAMTSHSLPAPPTYLVPGTNVLAVQVFQSSLGSSDLGFEASLVSDVAETEPPAVLRVVPAPGTTVNRLTELTVTFSEPVQGVVAAHLLVGGIGATSVTAVDGATYTFAFAAPPYGEVAIAWSPAQSIADLATPPNRFDGAGAGATWRYRFVDETPPRVAGLLPGAGSTVRSLTQVSVLFDEPVQGVEASDLLVNERPATSVTAVAASQYVFAFAEPAPGPVRLAWGAGHAIVDLAAIPNAFAGGSWTYRLDPDARDPVPYLSEVLASNTRTLADETRRFVDWIELFNPGPGPVNLGGWFLTDSAEEPAKWRFPATNVAGGGFLVVFASGEDRRVPGAPLHASFQLAAAGEYLALVQPDGVTVASEFRPAYPRQVPDVSYGTSQVPVGDGFEKGAEGVYFTKPTPGAANLGGTAVPGPVIEAVQHRPAVPQDAEDLIVTATVRASFRTVAGVTLRYRVLFDAETAVPMLDDGAHGDGAAGDGTYGATIPAAAPGQMIRYLVAAADDGGQGSRWPLFTQPTATEEYLGTIVAPTNLVSRLPVFHLFVGPTQTSRIDTESGGRVSFFHDGEFYDNVYVELRGNTSAGLAKKSHRLEFPRGHELRHPGPGGRLRRSTLLAEYLDPTYLRQYLSFWFLKQIGVPSPHLTPVRVQMNGQFYQLALHGDVLGQEQLERMGYDPSGALYKAVGNLTPDFSSTGVFQKLEPDSDPSRTDYLQLANGIHESASLAARRAAVFDLLDVPQVINHLAGTRWCAENDDVWANMCLYRDTFGDGLWRNIPFDMNASWGQLYGGSSPLEATVDSSKSHPLYGGSSTGGNFNRLYDVIVALPETRQMLLRRERSILDRMVFPPGTPTESLLLEKHIRDMTNLISAEAHLDRAKWGFSPWAPGKTFAAGVGDLLTQFVGPRRRHWYVTHSITNTARPIGITPSSNAGIPLAQPAEAFVDVVGVDFNPPGGNQNQEYVALGNGQPYAVDLGGWKLDGGVRFTFPPGTVIPSNSVLYVSPDVRAFRARTTGPRGGQGRFVVGPYEGQLSARGETLLVKNASGEVVREFVYAGDPSPAQRYLRVTELMYHARPLPGNPAAADEFAFVELRNTSTNLTLDLSGVRFAAGVEFRFAGSPRPSLAPGERVLVVKNPVAFAARYGGGLPVAGTFTGDLARGGERLLLLDAAGEEVLDFEYDDDWHPTTDGDGFSLVTVDDLAAPQAWNQPTQWRPSPAPEGSPGAGDGPPASGVAPVLIQSPVSQSLVPGTPLVLGLAVARDATLPLGILVRRNGVTLPPGPNTFFTVDAHEFFLSLSGAETSPPWTDYAFVVTNRALPQGVLSAAATLTYLADVDGNGLADAWETSHFGRTGVDPGADPDSDGTSTRGEALAGTDPTNAASHPRLEAFRVPSGVGLRFEAVSNRTYSVQYRDEPGTGNWTKLEDLPAMGRNRPAEVLDPGTAERRVYRWVTPRQP